MIELIAITQGDTEQVSLEVSQKPVELNFKYWDIEKPYETRSPYSYKFTLPNSRVNDRFFAFFYNANTADGTFDAGVKTDVQLYADGVLLMVGILELHKCDVKGGYEVSVLEQIAKVFDKIKGMTWPQLFTDETGAVDTDLDHALNWSNVTDSWDVTNDITTGAVGAGTIVYPLSDHGLGTSMNDQVAQTGYGFYGDFYNIGGTILFGGVETDTVPLQNWKPAVKVAYLVDYIFNTIGYTVTSNFMQEAHFQKLYMFLGLEQQRVVSRATYGCTVGIPSAITYPTSVAGIWQDFLFTDEVTAPFYDPDGLITAGQFVAPYAGTFTFTSRFLISTTSGVLGTGYQFNTIVTVNGDQVGAIDYTWVPNNQQVEVQRTFSVGLEPGDFVSMRVTHTNTLYTVTVTPSTTLGMTSLQLVDIIGGTGFVDVSQIFPNVTVDKWLKSIFEHFNLVLISNAQEPTVLSLEPWTDYQGETVTNRDWTQVIDADSVSIEPTTKYQKKTYLFSDGEGANQGNTWWQEHNGYVKGKYSYLNTNDFAKGDAKTQTVFSPLKLRRVYANPAGNGETPIPNVLLPHFWKWHEGSDGAWWLKEWVSNKPVLAYYNGLQDIGNGATFEWNGTDYSTYPYFAQYDTVPVGDTTRSLRWGYDWPDNFNMPFVNGGGGPWTQRYLFHEYWSQMFNELYSAESRVMTCKVDLSYTELLALNWNDGIFYDGCFWKLMEISNFALNANSLANAVLVKTLEKPLGRLDTNCDLRVRSIDYNGVVNFMDADGNPVSPTEDCCLLNGYTWDDNSNTCFSRAPQGGGGNGGGGNDGGGVGEDGTKPTINADVSGANTFNDWQAVEVKTLDISGTIGATIDAEVYATTSGTTQVSAAALRGSDSFTIPIDTVMQVRATAVITVTGGTAGTVGETSTKQIQFTVANTRSSGGKQPVARQVGTTVTLADNSDAGVSATLGVRVTQTRAGDAAYFNVTCTGQRNVDMQWFIQVEAATQQVRSTSATTGKYVLFNLTPDTYLNLDVTPDELLAFNLA